MFVSSVATRDVVALLVAACCWGLGTVVSKAALDVIPPLTLLPLQLAASLVVLAVLMRATGRPFRGDGPPLLGRLGVLNPGIAYALSLLGLAHITASLSVLLWALEPLLILGLAAVFLREPVTQPLVAWSTVAIVGVGLVVYTPSANGALLGVVLTVAGVVCCAGYTVIARRWLPEAHETGQVVFAQQAHGLAVALILVAAIGLAGAPVVPSELTPFAVASGIGSGALYYAGAYWFYLGALRHVPATMAAATFYLIPIVGVITAAALLDERLDVKEWAGAALVLVAVVAVLRQPVSAPVSIARPVLAKEPSGEANSHNGL